MDQATRILAEQAGTALNREMVGAFLSLVPIFPLGTPVRLQGPGLEGVRGVVVQQDRFDPARPVVRLGTPGPGAPGGEPIATAQRPEVALTVIAAPGPAANPGGTVAPS